MFHFKNYVYPLILFAVVVLLFITNYKPGTWLLGWDNLQSELNFFLNLKRNFFAGWQEYQGVGLASGHAHTVEFVRLITYSWLFLLPQSVIRYVFHFLMLFLGSFFVYKLCKDQLFKTIQNVNEYSFIASLFYLLSLGTMQNFTVPLEAYSVFYAYLPLVTLYFLKYVKEGGKRNLVLLSIANFLIIPAYHIQTYFIVLFVFLIVPVGIYSLSQSLKRNFIILKRFLISFVSIIAINLFWLLNVVYFVLNDVTVRFSSHINRYSSIDNSLKNLQFGNWYDVPLLRGFWFRNVDYSLSGDKFGYMLSNWIEWYGNKVVVSLAYLTFALVILGIVFAVKERLKFRYLLLYFIFVILFFLFSASGLFGFVFTFLSKYFPLFAEVFRFPFTKFIVPATLTFAILFAFGVAFISNRVGKVISIKKLVFIVFICLIYYSLPAFKGNFIYSNLKVDLPKYYLETISYLKTKDTSERIATLPQESFWDWKFNKWGFRGGGFLWYGIEQPILDRAFDVWNPNNEQFYNEFQYAIYSENSDLLTYTLQKYDISYLLLDKSVIAPGAPNATFIPQTKKLLGEIDSIKLDKTFGDIELYKITLPQKSNRWVVTPEKYVNTSTDFSFSNIDSLSNVKVSYISSPQRSNDKAVGSNDKAVGSNDKAVGSNDKAVGSNNNNYFSSMPARQLAWSRSNLINFPFADDNKLAVNISKNELKIDVTGQDTINLPDLNPKNPIPATVTLSDSSIDIKYLYPKVFKDSKNLYSPDYSEKKVISNNNYNMLINGHFISSPTIPVLLDKDSKAVIFSNILNSYKDMSNDIFVTEAVDCGGGSGEYGKRVNSSANSLELFLKNKNTCVIFPAEQSVLKPSVLKVEFEYQATEGSRPLYCLSYNDSGGCLNNKYENAPQAVAGIFTKFVDYIDVTDPVSYKFLAILESDDKQKEQTAQFRNIRITAYDITDTISLKPSDKAYKIGVNLNTKDLNSGHVIITFPDYAGLNKSYQAGDIAYNTQSKNCDNFNSKSFMRSYVLGKYIYTAEDAISCDTLDSKIINTSSSYLIDFVYKNVIGKGLDICMASGSLQKCMLQDRLGTVSERFYNSGAVKTESFVLPSYPSAEKIQINIGNQSIGNIKTVNELYSINVKYIPYEWLKGIFTTSRAEFSSASILLNDNNQILNLVQNDNRLKVKSVNKTQTYKYEITTNGQAGLLVLNQSFDKGWVMYKADSCLFGLATPITCKEKVSSHYLVSNWANGWITDDLDSAYVIIFWPQYLQFGGYLVLVLWFGFLIFRYTFKR